MGKGTSFDSSVMGLQKWTREFIRFQCRCCCSWMLLGLLQVLGLCPRSCSSLHSLPDFCCLPLHILSILQKFSSHATSFVNLSCLPISNCNLKVSIPLLNVLRNVCPLQIFIKASCFISVSSLTGNRNECMLTEDKRRKVRGDPQLKDWTLERQKSQELGESRCENFMDGIFRVSLLPQPFVITAPHSSRLAFFRLGVIHWLREGRETN